MEYFNTHKNTLFTLVTRIINQSLEGKNFTVEDIEALIKDTKLVDDDFIKNILDYGNNPYNIMTYDFKPFFGEDSIRINPTILEKRWIKSLLNEDIVRLFLDENTIEKLNKKLIDIEPLFQLKLPNQNINKHIIKTVIKAFRDNKLLLYNSVNKHGQEFINQIGIPFKINYSMRDYKFRLSIYSIIEERFIYINMENVQSMEILNINDMENSLYYEKTKSIKDKLDKLGRKRFFLTYLYQKKKTIKLQIYNGKNILERVHLLFASYHKKTYSEGGNQYIDISYYSFDEENIIRNILSLGLLVKVVEPNYIRKRILELLEKGRELDSLQMVKIYDK